MPARQHSPAPRPGRRSVLAGGTGLAATAALGWWSQTSPAAASPIELQAVVTDLGPASLALTFGNGVRIGDEVWFATRQNLPTKVAAYDLNEASVTKAAIIPGVPGLWGADAIGTDLYVGSYSPGQLFKIDTLTMEVELLVDLHQEVAWTVKASPDGKVFVGTYPSATLWEYDPVTAQSTDHGRMDADDQYVRDLVASDDTVYCGIGSHAGLVAFDRDTGNRTDILPPELSSRTFGAICHLVGNNLVVGISPTAEVLVLDVTNPSSYQILQTPDDSFVVGITSRTDEIWFATRPSGSLYRFRLGDTEPTFAGIPIANASNLRMGFLADGRLWSVQSAGGVFYDPATRTVEAMDTSSPELQATPERPMSLCFAGDRIVVGGSLGVQVTSAEQTPTFDSYRVPFGGEAKDMDVRDGTVYLGAYTLARLLSMPVDCSTVSELARVDAAYEQTRPTSVIVDNRRGGILMSTEPDYGRWEGALNIYDGQRFHTYRGVLPDQTVQALCPDPHGVFLGGNIHNGFGTVPTTTRAKLGYFDYATRAVSWLIEPTSGTAVEDLKLIGGLLVGTTGEGELFAVDITTRAVRWTIDTGAAGGKLAVVDNRVFGTDGTTLWTVKIGPIQPSLDVVATDLNQSWFGTPEVVTDGSSALFTIKGLNLVRVDLS